MDENTLCACGDVLDEHDENGECTIDDCMCLYFDAWAEQEESLSETKEYDSE
jgi:hypothetical protein